MADPTSAEETALDGQVTLLVVGEELWGVEFVGNCVDFAQHLSLLQTLAIERAKEVRALF